MTERADAADVAATFCATLADEWVRSGVTDVVVAPGSRSTPLTVAVAREPALRVHVVLDERSAGFLAVGLGRATGRPAVVVTTSGTAAVELHPAVVEADQDGVPLVCATADRPPELQGVGAPQTVEQVGLFGHSVRWAANPGPPDAAAGASWRSLGARSVLEAQGAAGRAAGPVHLNLAFREPLLGTAGPLPEGRPGGAPWHTEAAGGSVDEAMLTQMADAVRDRSGVIVAGAGAGDALAVHALATVLGWPVLADPRSGARGNQPTAVAYFDQVLRAPAFGAAYRPQVVLRLGRLPASKVLGQWLAAAEADEIVVEGTGEWIDPDRRAGSFVRGDPGAVCSGLCGLLAPQANSPGDGLAGWRRADDAAGAAIAAVLAAFGAPTEPGIARAALDAVPSGGSLVVSSSMPVRDVEWFGAARDDVTVIANRGANGIDGVVSTAAGVAMGTGRPTVLLIGDLAFLHDSNGLLGLVDRSVDLTIVVIDNRGGGIFSFLPQAGALAPDEFETLFGTPQPTDLVALAGAHGVPAVRAKSEAAIAKAVAGGGPQVVVLDTDRGANVEVHERLTAAVVAAVDG